MLSLGYTVLDWISEHLPSPADPSERFVFTDAQAKFTLRWYALDEQGQLVYRRGLLMEAKGWGKSPVGAALSIAEFAGPVLFDGFDAGGRPVGRPWGTRGAPPAWVQVAGVSEESATSNVYSLIFEMLTVNGGKAAEALGIDQGRTRLYLKERPAAKLEAVTSAAGSREGQRVT
ncbi:MAG: terminase, partial [Acidimicrobiia bacterium]